MLHTADSARFTVAPPGRSAARGESGSGRRRPLTRSTAGGV